MILGWTPKKTRLFQLSLGLGSLCTIFMMLGSIIEELYWTQQVMLNKVASVPLEMRDPNFWHRHADLNALLMFAWLPAVILWAMLSWGFVLGQALRAFDSACGHPAED
jgi:hypothetical protein